MVQAVNKHGEGPLSDLVVGQTKEAGEGGGERGSGHSQTLLINFPGVAGLSDQQFLHNYNKNLVPGPWLDYSISCLLNQTAPQDPR